MHPIVIGGLKDLTAKYNTYVVDVYGVIFDGLNFIQNAMLAVIGLARNPLNKVILLSNSGKSSEYMRKKLLISDKSDSYKDFLLSIDICTSGDALVQYFIDRSIGEKRCRLVVVGGEQGHDIIDKINIALRERNMSSLNIVDDISRADSIMLLASTDEHDLDGKNKLLEILKDAARFRLPCVCTNSDIVAPYGAGFVYCPGYYAECYAKMGQEVIFFGKPHRMVYDIAFSRLGIDSIEEFKKNNNILVIGDMMANDIAGASNIGFDSLLVGDMHEVSEFNKTHKVVVPNYIMRSLQW